jgi:hypothetical protein
MLSDGRAGQPSPDRARVRAWCREALDLGPDVTVMGTELACDDPDCPDVETVIALLENGRDPRMARIFLPASEVTEAHVYTALAELNENHEERLDDA